MTKRRASDFTIGQRIHQLIEDERGSLSSARLGLWITMLIVTVTIAIDIILTAFTQLEARIPNTVYGIEGTMFITFTIWTAGPRVAQYFGTPASVAQVLSNASREIVNRRKSGAEDGTEPT
jgi:hypothetical protein